MGKVVFNIGGVDIEMDKETASKAFEAGKVELTTDELVMYKKDDFDTFKTNLSNEEYKKGKKAGEEIPVKTAREELGLEFEGKTMSNLLEAYKAKTLAEAKVEPNKKIQELEADKSKLQNNFNTLQGEFDTFKTNITQQETARKEDSALLSFMPDRLKVDKDIALMALKSKSKVGISFNEAGQPLQMINGEVVKDQSLEPKVMNKDFMTEQLTTLGLVDSGKGAGGKGGEDETGGNGATSYENFVKRMEANNITQGSEEFNIKLNEEMKAGTVKM